MWDVIVVGGGPVGLLLAAELKLAGADPLILEAADGSVRRTRSLGLRSINTRSSQSLALRGLTGDLLRAQRALLERLATGTRADRGDFGGTLLEAVRRGVGRGHFSGLPLSDDGTADGTAEDTAAGDASGEGTGYVVIQQHVLEEILAAHAAALGVTVRTAHEVTGVADEGAHVRATLADGTSFEAAYLVGCDGGRSTVRKLAGIAFPGTPPTMTGRAAVAELADPGAVASSLRHPGGVLVTYPGTGQILTAEFDGGPDDRDAPVTAAEIEGSVRRVTGRDVTVVRLETGTRFSDNARQAETYRRGRILLAGDAAHVHSPVGGQGLNLGLQDAVGLGWKLALVARGRAPERLLDTYTAERRPVAARVLHDTRAQTALLRPGPHTEALRDVFAGMLAFPDVRRSFIERANGLDIDHAPGSAQPLTGRFLPALTPDHPAAAALREGRGLLFGHRAAEGHADRVEAIATALPGAASALVRPDGYVAWASSDHDPDALAEALTTWFGAPVEAPVSETALP